MNKKLIHSESSESAEKQIQKEILMKEGIAKKLTERLTDKFDLGDQVETKFGFDAYKYIEEMADYETLFIPKGTVGVIESSGWNMSNNFNTTFNIILYLDGNEIDYSIKEQDIHKYFKLH